VSNIGVDNYYRHWDGISVVMELQPGNPSLIGAYRLVGPRHSMNPDAGTLRKDDSSRATRTA
jgi:hypothetical protein